MVFFLSDPQVILKEREERKQRRLLEERGLLPEHESCPVEEAAEEEQHDTTGETCRSASIQSSLSDSYCLSYVSLFLNPQKMEVHQRNCVSCWL